MQPSTLLSEGKRNSRARAYVLLRTVQGRCEDALRVLTRHSGVVVVDRLEGTPDLMVIIEAPDRAELAETVVKALASIEVMTDAVELLPVQDKTVASVGL